MAQNFSELANFVWSVADLLRGDYKQADYGKVILPFTLLRRLDCVLESTKEDVLKEHAKRKESGVNLDPFLKRKSKQSFYNTSPLTVPGLLDDQKHIRQNLVAYLGDFSEDARDVFERFKFTDRVAELEDKNLLFQLVQKFANIDLHPDVVSNETMGMVFEELIRKFAEASNETAGAADLLSWSWLRERRRVDKGEKLGRHEEFRRLMNLPIDPHHWAAEAGEAIQWIKQVVGDISFGQWLITCDTNGKFLRWLMLAGPNALDYFREYYARKRTWIIRTQRR